MLVWASAGTHDLSLGVTPRLSVSFHSFSRLSAMQHSMSVLIGSYTNCTKPRLQADTTHVVFKEPVVRCTHLALHDDQLCKPCMLT